MNRKFILMIASTVLIAASSCSNDFNTDNIVPQAIEEGKISNSDVLSFASEEAYNAALFTLSHLETDAEKQMWVEQNVGHITSMYQTYKEAMNDAVLLDESEYSYVKFKEKYQSLYFPMYDEDYGFYLPFQNLDVSFLANNNAEVLIAGKLVSLRDIYNYNQLMRTGRAYYSEVKQTRATEEYESFRYDGKKDINSIGVEYDSGWYQENGKKLKLKLRRRIVSYWTKLHTEVCFRKKTWLGWTNYSSHTTITGTMTLYNCTINSIPFSQSHSGDSSHDSTFLIPVGCVQANSSAPYQYELFKMKVNCTISYRGMGTEKSYEFTFPRALSEEIPSYTSKTLKGYGF